MQLLVGARAASAAIAIVGCDAHETVGPPDSAVVSLSMLTKTAPPPTRARRAEREVCALRRVLTTTGRETPAGGGGGFAHVRRCPCARCSLRALTL